MEQVFSDSLGWFVFFICTWLALFAFPSSVKGYVKRSMLIVGLIVLTILLLGFHLLFAFYAQTVPFFGKLFVLIFFMGFSLVPIFSAYEQILPHTLKQDVIYQMRPDKFAYVLQNGKYKMLLKGYIFEKNRVFDVILLGNIETVHQPDLSQSLDKLYEQTGIFLSSAQKQALKSKKLKLNVQIKYHDLYPFKAPVVSLFDIGSQV